MQKFLVCAAALSCLLVVGSSSTMAQQCYSGGSGFGISVNYGNGFNNFGGSYNNGYRQPYYNSGYNNYGSSYPAYRSVQVYSAPAYRSSYYGGGFNNGGHHGGSTYLNHGSSYNHGYQGGGFGGGGHHRH